MAYISYKNDTIAVDSVAGRVAWPSAATMLTCFSRNKPRDSSQPVYEQLKILKLSDINKYLIGRVMFRYCN